MPMYKSPRQVLPPAPTMESGVNVSPQYARKKQINDILTHTLWLEQGNRTPKTSSPPKSYTPALGT